MSLANMITDPWSTTTGIYQQSSLEHPWCKWYYSPRGTIQGHKNGRNIPCTGKESGRMVSIHHSSGFIEARYTRRGSTSSKVSWRSIFRELKACVNPKPTDTFYFVQTPEARVGVAQICELYARRFTIVDIVCGKIKDLGGLTHQYAQLERG